MRAIVSPKDAALKAIKVQKEEANPTAGENEIVVRVKACGINFNDLLSKPFDNGVKYPLILGCEAAGVVETIADGVEQFKVGDNVLVFTEARAWAELVSVPVKTVYKLPDGLDFQHAVAIAMNSVVANCLLFDIGCLTSGQTVLIHSVGGGVGQSLIQLIKTIPNVTVIGTASEHKHEALKDKVAHLLDHGKDYVSEIKKIAPDGVDLVLDCLGSNDDINKGYNLLKPLGRYVLYGLSGDSKGFMSLLKSPFSKIGPNKLYDDNKTISGFNLWRLLFRQDQHEYIRKVVEKVFKLYQDKVLEPIIDETFAFEDIHDAFAKLNDRQNVGKVLLDPAKEGKPRPVEEPPKKNRKLSAKEKSATNGNGSPAEGEKPVDGEQAAEATTTNGGDKKEETPVSQESAQAAKA